MQAGGCGPGKVGILGELVLELLEVNVVKLELDDELDKDELDDDELDEELRFALEKFAPYPVLNWPPLPFIQI